MKQAFHAARLARRLVILALCAGVAAPAAAQPAGHTLGVGGQIGSPAGVTIKAYHSGARDLFPHTDAFALLAAWDLREVFLVTGHLLRERPVPDSPLRYFYGPGVVLGFEDKRRAGVVLGISAAFGVNFFRERFEVYLQLTPRLDLIPATRGLLDGGIGMRYYF